MDIIKKTQPTSSVLSPQEEEFYRAVNNYISTIEKHLAECQDKECHLRKLYK